MSTLGHAVTAPVSVADDLRLRDLGAVLGAGFRDFVARPWFGLFFASVYVLAGLVLAYELFDRGQVAWLIPAGAGFPLITPFVAVGLYEVSRRREAGLPMSWGTILGALRGRGDGQLLMVGIFAFVIFAFWILLARVIFAIFMSESGIGGHSLQLFLTEPGIMMMMVGGVVGAVLAMLIYSITVISLPMLVDRDVDFLTAIITSLRCVSANTFVFICWAAIIAVLLFVAMVPFFAGLLIVLPVLGHATWHLYRRAVGHDDG